MDERYEARRAKISEGAKSSGDHLLAGVKGLAHGFWGGLTSIVSQTYEGATKEGIGVGAAALESASIYLYCPRGFPGYGNGFG